MIKMKMSDGAEIAVYRAEPTGKRKGGLVLVQEIFGVTDHIRELCDEYAADGYEVLSPALFDREHPVFITGYCYGGSVAWAMAGQSETLAAASCYYGSLIPTLYADAAPKCATIAHFGRYDTGIPMEGVEALIAKEHPAAQIFVYDANHGFNSDRRKDYHEPSAILARERTLGLFKACGGI